MKKPIHRFPSEFSNLWALDPGAIYFNHGSFGACTKYILERQQEYRNMLEAQPMKFMIRQLEPLLNSARNRLASFVSADPSDLVFVRNASEGVFTVLQSLDLHPGDEILYTGHLYYACRKQLEYLAEIKGIVPKEVFIDIPVRDPGNIVEAVVSNVSPLTKLVFIDHITSPTALIQPVETIIREMESRGIDTLVDGAHSLGSIPLDLGRLGSAYYTANCHKWLCSPKSSAILHVRKDRQKGIRPLLISHAGHRAESFTERFYWPGTWDPSAALCAADALDYGEKLMPGGWEDIMKRNHDLCLKARDLMCSQLGFVKTCPDEMNASMSTMEIPSLPSVKAPDYKSCDPLQDEIFREYNLEIPLWFWSDPPRRTTRISVQLYNSYGQFEYLVSVLKGFLN